MKDLTSCRFIEFLHLEGENISDEEIESIYTEFCGLLVSASDSPTNYITKFRALSDLCARLQILSTFTKKKPAVKFLS